MSKYVKCPKQFESIFQKAEEIMCPQFEDKNWDPNTGNMLLGGERYIMYRGKSMAIALNKQLNSVLGSGATNVIYQIGKACGSSDGKYYFEKLSVEDPQLRLAMGPVSFAMGGYALVEILPESAPAQNDDFLLVYDHPNSYEAESYIETGETTDKPVDFLNAGYSAGWCSEAFGLKLDAKEISCKAKGDRHCRFVMAPPRRLREHVKKLKEIYSID